MKYLMLINSDEREEAGWDEKTSKQVMGDYMQFSQAAREAGKMIGGDRLHPTKAAVRIRERGGQRVVTDGPFSEAKEVLGGYWFFECANRDEALEWAARSPAAKYGNCDVREVHELDSDRETSRPTQPGRAAANGKQRWMALVLGENKAFDPWTKDMERIAQESPDYFGKLEAAKIDVEGFRLHHERSGFQVRVRNGKRIVTDGPFSETKEALGGIFVIEVDSKAQAIEWISKFPGARYGTMELRETWPVPRG